MKLPADQQRLHGLQGLQEAYAFHDYGRRKWPKASAFVVHMADSAETNPRGVSSYLRREHGPVTRGVSATFAVEIDGTTFQMLGLDHVSGSISPARLCRTESGIYGYSHAAAALGDRWGLYVNHAVLSVEIGGKAVHGPTPAAVAAVVRLFEAVREVYPAIVPLAHADFANCNKSCPGKSAAIRAAFAGMGGHGLDYHAPAKEGGMSSTKYVPGMVCDAVTGAAVYDDPLGRTKLGITEPAPAPRDYLGSRGGFVQVSSDLGGGRTVWIRAADVTHVRARPVPTAPADPATLQAAHDAAIDEASAAVIALKGRA